jgi:hypothetical protein
MNNTPAPNKTDCASGQRAGRQVVRLYEPQAGRREQDQDGELRCDDDRFTAPHDPGAEGIDEVRTSTEATASASISNGACGSAEKVVA